MEWIVFTPDQVEEVLAWSMDTDFKIVPRLIDDPEHTLAGNAVTTTVVVEGEYAPYWADRLAGHSRIKASPDDLFLPPDDMR